VNVEYGGPRSRGIGVTQLLGPGPARGGVVGRKRKGTYAESGVVEKPMGMGIGWNLGGGGATKWLVNEDLAALILVWMTSLAGGDGVVVGLPQLSREAPCVTNRKEG